jgi:hypothetical protein
LCVMFVFILGKIKKHPGIEWGPSAWA